MLDLLSDIDKKKTPYLTSLANIGNVPGHYVANGREFQVRLITLNILIKFLRLHAMTLIRIVNLYNTNLFWNKRAIKWGKSLKFLMDISSISVLCGY